jgi:hypothetical protein
LSIPHAVAFTCVAIVLFLLALEFILVAIYIKKTKKKKTKKHAKKAFVAVGNALGYAAIIITIFAGATEATCIVIPTLLDLSFLFCGGRHPFLCEYLFNINIGTLSLSVMQKLISNYKHMAVKPNSASLM